MTGDPKHKGVELLVHPKKVRTFEQVIYYLLELSLLKQLKEAMIKVELGTITVMTVYTPELKQLHGLEEIVDGGKYLAVGKEGLLKDKGLHEKQIFIFTCINSTDCFNF